MARTLLLVELTGYTAAGVSAVYRYSTGKYWTEPGDTPPSTEYDDRVVDPGTITRTLFAAGASGIRANPQAQVDYGLVRLDNLDGALDSLFDGSDGVSFRERQVRILAVAEGAAYSTATVLLVASISQPLLEAGQVTVGIKGRLYTLASAHQTVLFAGSNSLPSGLEGVDDLKGKPKPLIYGRVYSFEPPQVNTARLIYQVSARALHSLIAAYDGVATLTAGSTYSSQADMETNVPSAGQYRVWYDTAACYLRLASEPAAPFTVDAQGDSDANSTPAQLLKRLALDRGWASGDISASDVTALDALTTAVCGVVVQGERTTTDAMDDIARAAGVAYWEDLTGTLRLVRFDEPSGTPALVLDEPVIDAVDQLQAGEDVPTGTVKLHYARYHKVHSRSEVLASVSEARTADAMQEWRVATATSTPSPNPYARLLSAERFCALATKAAADTEAARLLALADVPRRTHRLRGVELTAAEQAELDLGSVVELRWPRYGFDPEAGTLRRVIAITTSLGTGLSDVTVWG